MQQKPIDQAGKKALMFVISEASIFPKTIGKSHTQKFGENEK